MSDVYGQGRVPRLVSEIGYRAAQERAVVTGPEDAANGHLEAIAVALADHEEQAVDKVPRCFLRPRRTLWSGFVTSYTASTICPPGLEVEARWEP